MTMQAAIFEPTTGGGELASILCCMCGIPIIPNAANTCASCIASETDITKGISTEATLHQCRGCQRWHKETGKWIACELESRELMALCLSNVSGLKKPNNSEHRVRLIDATWIWTEPHSMRLKVKLTIQREVQKGTILQQSFVVVFIVRNQQCVECQAEFRQGSWKALVQVRQRVSHKRTFLYLEQLILKHGAHRGCLNIKTFRDGMDFYFPDKGKAARFISFLDNVCPIKVKTSKKLISTDDKNNLANFKYTNIVEICPLCKDDLLYLPAKVSRNLGNISRLVMVKRISNVIHLIDPLSGQVATMNPECYWRDPIRPLITAARSRMTRYVILGKEPVFLRQNVSKKTPNKKMRTRLASVTLAREEDLGVNDNQLVELSCLGYLLKAGDICLGYDLKDSQFIDDDAESLREKGNFPDVIVVRKLYGVATSEETNSTKKRIWKLQRLHTDAVDNEGRGKNMDIEEDDKDEEDFMQEIEADKEMRLNVNLYKSNKLQKRDQMHLGYDEDEDDDQQIKLEELLEGLALDSKPDEPEDFILMTEDRIGYAEGASAAKDGLNYVSQEESRHVRDKDVAFRVSAMGKDFLA